jgi:hypothetical protein
MQRGKGIEAKFKIAQNGQSTSEYNEAKDFANKQASNAHTIM